MSRSLTFGGSTILREPGETPEGDVSVGRPTAPAQDRAARLAARVALAITAGLAVWSIVLSADLPTTSVSQHWRLVWVGLDVAMALGSGATALLLIRGDRRAALASMGTSTLLAFDAWFDVCTSGGGFAHGVAVAEAVVFEVPLAIGGICLALRLLKDPQEGADTAAPRPDQLP